MAKGQGQTAGLWKNIVNSISLDSFDRKLPNLVQEMPLESRWPVLMFRSHVQRSRSICWFSSQVLSTRDLMILCMMVIKFAILVNYLYWVTRARSNYSSSSHHCPLNIIWTICLVINKPGTLVATRYWIIHCIYTTLLNFSPGVIYVSQTIPGFG